MDVTVSPRGGTAQGVVLTMKGDRANVTCDSTHSRVYRLGVLKYAKTVAITVSIPSTVTSGSVVVTAHVDGDNAAPKDFPTSFTVTKPKPSTSPKPSASHSSGSGSGSGGGTSGGVKSNPAPPGNVSGAGGTTGSAGTAPQTAPSLPSIDQQQQAPTTAPDPAIQHAGNTESMRGTAEAGNQLTFDKLASTQAAWLAALLVAFSLLLTQVRLGKARVKEIRPKGAHRKTRPRVRHVRAH